MPRPMCGGQRAACESRFFPSTWQNPGTEVRSSGLAKPDFKIFNYGLLSMPVLNTDESIAEGFADTHI